MPSQVLSARPFGGLIDVWSPGYSFQSCIVRNTLAGTVSVTQDGLSLMPVKIASAKAELVAAASVNTITALILEADGPIVALATDTDSTVKALCLVRGPAIVRDSAIKLFDAANAAQVLATIKTALLAVVPPIIVMTANANRTVQAT